MKTMNMAEIAGMIIAALDGQRESQASLAQAIVTILRPVPNGTVIKTPSYYVERCKLYCGCSQGDNGSWDVTGVVDGYLVAGMLIRDEQPTVFDGHDRYFRRTPLYRKADFEVERGLKLAPARVIRCLARELPDALAKYVADKQADAVESKSSQAVLATA